MIEHSNRLKAKGKRLKPEGDIYEPEIKVNLYNGKIEGKQEAKGTCLLPFAICQAIKREKKCYENRDN